MSSGQWLSAGLVCLVYSSRLAHVGSSLPIGVGAIRAVGTIGKRENFDWMFSLVTSPAEELKQKC